MSELQKITRHGELGPFSGVGPHAVPTELKIYSTDFGSIEVHVIIYTASSPKTILYEAKTWVRIDEGLSPVLSAPQEITGDSAWLSSQNQTELLGVQVIIPGITYQTQFGVAVVDDELVGSITAPSGQPDFLVEWDLVTRFS